MKERKILQNKAYLLSPYFPSSQIVWTIIIGIIMIAMALGNVYGGRSADKDPVGLPGIHVIDQLINEEAAYYRDIYEEKGMSGVMQELGI